MAVAGTTRRPEDGVTAVIGRSQVVSDVRSRRPTRGWDSLARWSKHESDANARVFVRAQRHSLPYTSCARHTILVEKLHSGVSSRRPDTVFRGWNEAREQYKVNLQVSVSLSVTWYALRIWVVYV